MRKLSSILFLTLLGLLAATAPSGPTYDLSWHSIDGGGGLSMGGSFDLYGVIGQHDAGTMPMTGGSFILNGGFLAGNPSASCPADSDGSGAVDILDLLDVLAKWGPCPASCPEDNDGSGTVDILDLLNLLAAWGVCP